MVRGDGGFTLVELMLSLVMAVTILSVLYGTYSSATASARACRARSALYQEGRSLMDLIGREVRCGYVPVEQGEEADERTVKGDEEALVVGVDEDVGGGHVMDVLTAGGIDAGAGLRAGLNAVAYHVESDGTLLRRQVPAVAAGDLGADEGLWLPVARGVEDIAFEYYDGEDWQSDWTPQGEEQRLPPAVRISVVLERGEREKTFATAVYTGLRTAERKTLVRETARPSSR
jgi:type II secretion system protein J